MPPVTAFKWAFGHLIAAAGIVETVLALAALKARRGAGHRHAARTLDPACDGLAGVGAPRRCRAPMSRSSCAAASPAPTLRGAAVARVAMSDAPPLRRRRPTRCQPLRHRLASRSRASSACCAKTTATALLRFFSAQELADAGDGPGRAASLAARFAAKEACVKLFPREAALAQVEPHDFSVARDNYGAPRRCSRRARRSARRPLSHRRHRAVADARSHERASAVAVAQPAAHAGAARRPHPLSRCFRCRRRVIMDNLRRVYGATLDADADRATWRRRTTGTCGGSPASSCAFAGFRASSKLRAGAHREPRRLRGGVSSRARASCC